ncbi:MAG: quinone-dependent dihydroorotate dehydrogenase [Rhodospirillales bacterium]|nr:quinone-dependent dihydroorotate dehydrogenase [Rhodospirillales bacterium]
MADLATRLYGAVGPGLRRLEPETAHRITIAALKAGVVPRPAPFQHPALQVRLWGLEFPNPIGLAAGFDKNAEVAEAVLRLGFGFTEVGTVTPRPQRGNPRPRIFRLPEECAMINRLGFNNDGLEAVARRLQARRSAGRSGIVGANVGPNRDSVDPIADCARAAGRLAGLADYLVVNVSSPNTPGLRALQDKAPLQALLAAVLDARTAAGVRPPLLLKIAPDLTPADREDIAAVALAANIDGLIATNTTVARPAGLRGVHAHEHGGLSGPPLMAGSTAVLAEMYRLTGGRMPIIGVGGITGGADAYAKIRAGASLVQLYTALVYRGPGLVSRIQRKLVEHLRADGLNHLHDAVGSGVEVTEQ